MNNDLYYVSRDLQGGEFAMGRTQSIEDWRKNAMEWAWNDDMDWLVDELSILPQNEVIDFISEIWQLEFKQGYWQGTPVDNKHGIEFYYEFSTEVEKMYILDSNGNYFDDLMVDLDDKEDKQSCVEMLENTTLEEMVNFFACKKLYNSLEELQYDQQDNEITEDNEYVNIFKVNDKKYYVWSE